MVPRNKAVSRVLLYHATKPFLVSYYTTQQSHFSCLIVPRNKAVSRILFYHATKPFLVSYSITQQSHFSCLIVPRNKAVSRILLYHATKPFLVSYCTTHGIMVNVSSVLSSNMIVSLACCLLVCPYLVVSCFPVSFLVPEVGEGLRSLIVILPGDPLRFSENH